MNFVSRIGQLTACAVLVASGGGAALADELQVLSAGAIEPGLTAAAAAFEKQSGHVIHITFNTAPELRKRMDSNPAFDVVIALPAVMADFAAVGKLLDTRANVGRVGVGVDYRQEEGLDRLPRVGFGVEDVGVAGPLAVAVPRQGPQVE